MTRTARLTVPGELYQVVSYLRDGAHLSAEERARFLLLLGRALERSDWRCIGYCLARDRLRFAMIAGERPMESWARRAHGSFARWFNRRHGRQGPVFADRPSTLEVSSQLVASLLADMHDSPDGVETAVDQVACSSRGAYLGLSPAPEWLDVKGDLALVPVVHRPNVDRFTSGPSVRPCIAQGARQDAIELRQPIAVASRLSHRRDRPEQRSALPALLASVSERCAIPLEALQRRYGKGAVAKAKRIAIHAAIESGVPIARVSAALGITRQRGSAIAQLELAAEEALLIHEVVAAVRQGCHVSCVPEAPRRFAV